LKPQRAGIDEVPRLPFVFYNPDLKPSERAFQVIWTDAVPITVLAPDPIDPVIVVSKSILERAPTAAVLADTSAWAGPNGVLLADCAQERFGTEPGAADVVAAARAFITTAEEPPRD